VADLVVLDTHALIWWTSQPARIGARGRRAIEDASQVGIPAVCFWEVALLARKRRLQLGLPAQEWMALVLTLPRVIELPLEAAIAVRADALAMHDDPADRFIASTALVHGPLVTKDALLRRVPGLTTVW
jgi:PIN domain nuclease of toxin-antitoxin system